jgi:predicted O-methyltransferase YrrM
MSLPPLYIEIPAWGRYYVDLACQFTVPAAIASLERSGFVDDVTFLVHTDDEVSFRKALGGYRVRFMPMLPLGEIPADQRLPRLPSNYWEAFKKAHQDAIKETPRGGVVALLNSDIVVSRECFSFVELELVELGKKTVVSVGIRTQIEDNDGPPIGAAADELFRWCWAHRHHLTHGVVWGVGRSVHPTVLFFDDGEGNVALHGFHLTPMFIRKDREFRFSGTIDDDLLGSFRDEEISFITDAEVAFCEISPTWKTHTQGKLINVPDILKFWGGRVVRPHYLRNFRQQIRIMGDPQSHPAVAEIIEGLARGRPVQKVVARPVRPVRLPRKIVGERPGQGNQDPDELNAFLDLVRELGVRSYLEIGSRNGFSFWHVMQAIGPGGRGLSIDLSESVRTKANLLQTLADLRSAGSSVDVIFGNSQSPDIITKAKVAAPFDLVFIDADHRYEGVARDFEVYRHLGCTVALHDVAAPDTHMSDGYLNGVGRFWREIRGQYRYQEIETPGSCMGFGVLLGPSDLAEKVAAACWSSMPPEFSRDVVR